MKNLKDEIEGIKKEFEERFWSRLTDYGDSPSGCEEIWDFVEEKLTQSTTSLIEQEKERAVREFLEWYGRTYPDGVWRRDEVVIGEYLAERKE